MPRSKSPPPLTSAEIKAKADAAEGLTVVDLLSDGDDEEEVFDPDGPKAKMGRPPSYSPEYCSRAEKLCLLGATDNEIADFFGVSVRTLHRWKNDYPDFCHALKTGKGNSDERIERSLFHKAVGYVHTAVKVFLPAGSREPVYAVYKEHVPPDTTAIIFWLKNRRPDAWREKHELSVKRELGELSDQEVMDAIVRLRTVQIGSEPATETLQ